MDLLPCSYRQTLSDSSLFYCRHSLVGAKNHLVNENVCLICTAKDKPCANPRPLSGHSLAPLRTKFPWTYFTAEQLMADTKRLIAKLPADVSAIAGVPRSGLLPATILAEILHLPLYQVSQKRGLQALDHGVRLNESPIVKGPMLIVDDSLNTGRSLEKVRQIMAASAPHAVALYAVIYPVPTGVSQLDYYVRPTPPPRVFEWNLCNCNLTRGFAFDLDGVICEDWLGDEYDAAKYADFLRHAIPLYPPRRSPVPLIVTARLQKHRAATTDWLARRGVRFGQLIMGPWGNIAQRRRQNDAGEFKGQAYKNSDCRLFLESNEQQAKAIFDAAHKPVLCVTTGRIFQ